ncbi:MAG TPA: acetamidase/formamidase family protein [Candidatus Acidoferrum sp.]|nr:acetamidase/formamidase family protein [Candidatus Methylomirabilis sp.]HWU36976.1 acetamidase/formamidase family protein [Candidatus Acidoferrum sp.]
MLHINRDHIVYSLDKAHPPAAIVDPGTEMCFETWDARTGTVQKETDLLIKPHPKGPNPATGPVAVRGAAPGDALTVEIRGIKLASRGYTGIRPKQGVLGHLIREYRTKVMDIVDGMVVFNERIRFPVRPMVGVIGTAPAGEGIGTMHPGPHGGNMDHNDVRVGARVHLPVFVPQGLLAIGDVHACMGDGEVSITALEICGEVATRVDLVKGEAITRPWIEFPDCWIATGDGPTIGDAIGVACEEMVKLLQRQRGLSVDDAYLLLSIRGDVRVSQCAEPAAVAATARVVMPKL